MRKITIAIDGHSSTGKSTIARELARKLNYIYIDTGAMYRAATLAVLKNDVDPADKRAVVNIVNKSNIELKIITDSIYRILYNIYILIKLQFVYAICINVYYLHVTSMAYQLYIFNQLYFRT